MDFTITYDFSSELGAARDQAVAIFEDWYEAACESRNITPLASVEDFFNGTEDIEDFISSAAFSAAQQYKIRKIYNDVIELDKMTSFLALNFGNTLIEYSMYKWLLDIANQPVPTSFDLAFIRTNY